MPDYRSDPMDSPEGAGRARRAWDAYSGAVNRRMPATVERLVRKVAVPVTLDLLGFWLVWQVEGGFEGMRKLGLSRSAIYRRVKKFRELTGSHPDEYEFPGVRIDVKKYRATPGATSRTK